MPPPQLLLQRNRLVCGDHDMDEAVLSGPRTCLDLRLLIFAKLLKSRVAAKRVEHGIKPEERRCERH